MELGARIVAEAMQDCRGEIVWLHPAVFGIASDPVGDAVNLAAADAAAG
jgi:hypothetical protein